MKLSGYILYAGKRTWEWKSADFPMFGKSNLEKWFPGSWENRGGGLLWVVVVEVNPSTPLVFTFLPHGKPKKCIDCHISYFSMTNFSSLKLPFISQKKKYFLPSFPLLPSLGKKFCISLPLGKEMGNNFPWIPFRIPRQP